MSQAKQKSKPTSGPKTLPKYNLTQLLNRVNDRFPNFLLGLTVFVLAILVGSLFFQNQELSTLKIPQSITKLFGGKTNEVEQTTPKSYTVKKGDTLYSISWAAGKDFSEIAKLNQLDKEIKEKEANKKETVISNNKQSYDFDSGVLFFLAPNQLFNITHDIKK